MMKNKLFYGILVGGVVVIAGISLFVFDKSITISTPEAIPPTSSPIVPTVKEESLRREIGLPSPAGAYCQSLGYKLGTRTSPDGSQYRVCIFPDGSQCEQWDFFRGKCNQQFTFCEQRGFTIKNIIDKVDSWIAEYAVCIFDDSSECLERDYWQGKCSRSECKKWRKSGGGCMDTPYRHPRRNEKLSPPLR